MTECNACNDTGYVPFVKPDGSISKHAQLVCPDCGGYNHERNYADARMPDWVPSDIDFPCSNTWRGFYNGERVEPHQLLKPIGAGQSLDDRRWATVQQLRAEVKFLRGKVTEKRVEKKRNNDNYEPF